MQLCKPQGEEPEKFAQLHAMTLYPPIRTMDILIGESRDLTPRSPATHLAPVPQQKFKHTSRWCLSHLHIN